jgi:Arc/MetJ-type ribon-helix-helix transcriptional regulator
MNIEIHNPELVQRVNAQIQSGHFHDADELIEKALDALEEKAPAQVSLAEHSGTPPDRRTGADLIAALQASPYRELDIEPPKVRLTTVRDVVL